MGAVLSITTHGDLLIHLDGVNLSSLPVFTLPEAKREVEEYNRERERSAIPVDNGCPEETTYTYPEGYKRERFLATSREGISLIVHIENLGGGGRVSNPPDPERDFCNAWIEHIVHARVET